jgi:hypothetical protein
MEKDRFQQSAANLVFTVLCLQCSESSPVKGSGKCSVCGAPLETNAVEAIRESIHKRRKSFKVRLLRLVQRMREVTDDPLEFKSQGTPRSPEDHFHLKGSRYSPLLFVRRRTPNYTK